MKEFINLYLQSLKLSTIELIKEPKEYYPVFKEKHPLMTAFVRLLIVFVVVYLISFIFKLLFN